MATFSVSLPQEKAQRFMAGGFSPSKVFNLGLDLALSGGIDAFDSLKRENQRLKKDLQKSEDDLEIQKIQIANLRSELRFCQGRVLEADIKNEQADPGAEADRVLEKMKEGKP